MNQSQYKKITLHLERVVSKLDVPDDGNPLKKTLKELIAISGILFRMNGIAPLGIAVGLVFSGMGVFDMAALPDASINWEKVFLSQLDALRKDSIA